MRKKEAVLWGMDLLQPRRELRLRIGGGSMSPVLREGDVVDVVPASESEIVIGDIVIFSANRTLMAHRVIRKYGNNASALFVTKGDASCYRDVPRRARDILAKVVSVESGGLTMRFDGPSAQCGGHSQPRALCILAWLVHFLHKLKARQFLGR